MEEFSVTDWIGVILLGLIGLIPIVATVVIAWYVMFGGQP
jgi:hypothetical protein